MSTWVNRLTFIHMFDGKIPMKTQPTPIHKFESMLVEFCEQPARIYFEGNEKELAIGKAQNYPKLYLSRNHFMYDHVCICFCGKMQGSISFGLNNSRIFFIFPKTTPVVFLPTALPSLYSLPGPQMARRAKKEEVTGG